MLPLSASIAWLPPSAQPAYLVQLPLATYLVFGTSYGLGVSVDVTEGSDRYGTVVCAADVNGTITDLTRGYRTVPADIRRRAALWAVEYLRLALLGRV